MNQIKNIFNILAFLWYGRGQKFMIEKHFIDTENGTTINNSYYNSSRKFFDTEYTNASVFSPMASVILVKLFRLKHIITNRDIKHSNRKVIFKIVGVD
jgi:hypothetical protein